MAELKLHDFEEMINTATEIGKGFLPSEEICVQIEDDEGEIYDIVDIKFNPMTRAVHIKLSFDNEE